MLKICSFFIVVKSPCSIKRLNTTLFRFFAFFSVLREVLALALGVFGDSPVFGISPALN